MNDLSEESREIKATMSAGERADAKFKLLGVLPLIFFAGQFIFYWRGGSLGNMLWMCNIGNLLLAIGIFIGHRELIRATAIWTIPGIAVWFWFVLLPYGFILTSTLAHVGGFVVGLIAMRRVRADRLAWRYAFVWYLLMQAITRLTTSPDLNVNVAYRIQSGWEPTFTSFWKFWLVMSAFVALGLWVIGRLLNLLWPAPSR